MLPSPFTHSALRWHFVIAVTWHHVPLLMVPYLGWCVFKHNACDLWPSFIHNVMSCLHTLYVDLRVRMNERMNDDTIKKGQKLTPAFFISTERIEWRLKSRRLASLLIKYCFNSFTLHFIYSALKQSARVIVCFNFLVNCLNTEKVDILYWRSQKSQTAFLWEAECLSSYLHTRCFLELFNILVVRCW